MQVVLAGHTLPPATLTLLSSYAMGRDPTIFPQPDTIDPDRCRHSECSCACCRLYCRWDRARAGCPDTRHRQAWASLPFGRGARSCIGRRLAELELTTLATRACQVLRVASA